MTRRWRKRRKHAPADLSITAFMNLMVILVPFLLITAVFSRLAVLELNLPAPAAEPNEATEPELELEVTVRATAIEIGDRRGGLLGRIGNTSNGYDLEALASHLKRIKQRFPDKVDATLLLEPEISYQVLVDVMDTMRVAESDEPVNRVGQPELFPEISIGDAPMLN